MNVRPCRRFEKLGFPRLGNQTNADFWRSAMDCDALRGTTSGNGSRVLCRAARREITPQYQSAPNFAPHRRAMLPRQGVSFFASRCGAAERSDWRELVYDAGSRACASGGFLRRCPNCKRSSTKRRMREGVSPFSEERAKSDVRLLRFAAFAFRAANSRRLTA